MPQPPVRPLRALELARRIEAGDLTPAEVVDLCAEAIAAREETIGAFAALDLAGTRARAAASAATLEAAPLRGLPVGIKDIFDTADLPTEYGTPIYAGHRPVADAALVAMARRAGGLILGKTVTTPFAFLDPAGTANPHHPEHTPGGSSSGSAAAVAAGLVPIAIGTQTGGSVIRPASYCGVAGYKPSFRMLPMVGCKTFSWSLDTAGVFAAGVADVAFAAAALTGRDLRVDRAAAAAPRVGVVRTHVWPQASAAMQALVERTAKVAASAGATVREIALPPVFEDAFRAHALVQDYEAFRALAHEHDHHRDQLGPLLRHLLDAAATIRPEAYDDARRVAKRARQTLADLMDDLDVLLTPSAPGAAPRGLGSTGLSTFNRLWTLMGTPCINVPGAKDESGLPLGIQIVGRFGRDRAALEAALFVEQLVSTESGG
ncbi:Putative amidase AmiD [Rhodoplanes serenus]|uniref:Amidase AmiD n=1 Tax=Rhodoplanes serenus TaxID=200615 RepID=A0A447CYM7_9BRAD|nr:amidase [Rhodoplanes serenus]VCU10407.1 Putative amidase AmiD [Rhodoplanes serenus]